MIIPSQLYCSSSKCHHNGIAIVFSTLSYIQREKHIFVGQNNIQTSYVCFQFFFRNISSSIRHDFYADLAVVSNIQHIKAINIRNHQNHQNNLLVYLFPINYQLLFTADLLQFINCSVHRYTASYKMGSLSGECREPSYCISRCEYVMANTHTHWSWSQRREGKNKNHK